MQDADEGCVVQQRASEADRILAAKVLLGSDATIVH
jgi:hypothetical protein